MSLWFLQIFQKTNEFFFRISALASKKRSNQKNRGTLYHYTLMRFFYLKEKSTDITVDSIFKKLTLIQNTLFSCTIGTDWDKFSKSGLTFGQLRKQKVWNFDLELFFFQAKTRFWNFYINMYAYLKPVLKNLIAGLFESVEKSTKSWKL